MFVESVLRERVCIHPRETSIKEAAMKKLLETSACRHVDDLGVCLAPLEIVKVEEVFIDEGMLYPLVTYKLLAFRLYPGELLGCVVERQDHDGVHLSNAMLPSIFVPHACLPEPHEKVLVSAKHGSQALLWAWSFRGSSLYVKNGDPCRVKVLSVSTSKHSMHVQATMSDPGLGPRSWW